METLLIQRRDLNCLEKYSQGFIKATLSTLFFSVAQRANDKVSLPRGPETLSPKGNLIQKQGNPINKKQTKKQKKQTNINSDDNMPPPETTPYYNIP